MVAAGVPSSCGAASTDPVLETVVALVTPYAAYVLGEAAARLRDDRGDRGRAGPSAARRDEITTAQTRLQLHAVYQTVIFLLESVVFSLIGLQLPALIRAAGPHRLGLGRRSRRDAATLIAVRALWVFPLSPGPAAGAAEPAPVLARVPAVVSWAGARGVVPLAAALSIPLTRRAGHPLAARDWCWCWPPRSSSSRCSCKGSPSTRWPGSPE